MARISRYCHAAQLHGMFELSMAAFGTNANPAVPAKQFEYVADFHCKEGISGAIELEASSANH